MNEKLKRLRQRGEFSRGLHHKHRKTRFVCLNCGNSGVFLFAGKAEVEDLLVWSGRALGYQRVLERPLMGEVEYEKWPVLCYVCRSDKITYARVNEGEYDDVHDADEQGDPEGAVASDGEALPRASRGTTSEGQSDGDEPS